jgi:restriction endonuclease S subunit
LVYLFNQRFFERFCDRWIHQAAFQKEKMLEIQVYFPNLVKQNHIVNTIETKLKSVEKAKQAAEEQLKAADALQEAYLREVFGFDKLPQGWENVRLGTITELITKGTTPTTMGFQFQDKGINFIKIESIMKNGNFLPEKFKHISKDCYNVFNRSQLKENDVLFSIAGALGRIAIVNKNILPANINQAIALVRFYNNTVDYNFVFYVLRSGYVFKQFNKWKRGNAQLNISLENIRDIIIPLPSYKEQKRIAGIIETKLKSVEKAKQLLDQQLSYINALPSAILRQAFNGEL